MVGGIADWFAVTALFRHPLGLPIPHTAIIPRNKDRIGDTLASFLKRQFPHPLGGRAADAARRRRRRDRPLPRPSRPARAGCAQGGSRLLADILEALDQERLGGMVKARGRRADARASRSRPCSARRSRRRSPRSGTCRCSTAIVTWAGRTLDANEDLIRDMVHQRAGWMLRWPGSTRSSPTRSSTACASSPSTWRSIPHHPLRAKAEEGLARLAAEPPARSRDSGQGRGVEERDDRQSGGRRLARRRLGE